MQGAAGLQGFNTGGGTQGASTWQKPRVSVSPHTNRRHGMRSSLTKSLRNFARKAFTAPTGGDDGTKSPHQRVANLHDNNEGKADDPFESPWTSHASRTPMSDAQGQYIWGTPKAEWNTALVAGAEESEKHADFEKMLFGHKAQGKTSQGYNELTARWMIHPSSGFRKLWDFVTMILVVVLLFWVPFDLGFDYGADRHGSPAQRFWWGFDVFMDVFFVIDLVINFRTAIMDDGELIQEPVAVAKTYAMSWFPVDLIATLPLDRILIPLLDTGREASLAKLPRFLRFLRLIRLMRLMRLMKVRRLLDQWEEFGLFASAVWRLFRVLFAMVAVGHILGCGWFFVADLNGLGMDTWAGEYNLQSVHSTFSEKYTVSVYWAFVTVTTVGYGDVVPVSTTERQFVIMCTFIGNLAFAYMIGKMTAMAARVNASGQQFTAKMDAVNEFMRHHMLPKQLRQRIRSYYDTFWAHGIYFNENKILSELSFSLRRDVDFYLKREIIVTVPFFQDADPNFIAELISQLDLKHCQADEFLVQQGEIGYEMYIIKSGEVVVFGPTGMPSHHLGDGAFFGEVCLLDATFKRTATVKAVQPCVLYTLTKASLDGVLEHYPQFREAMMAIAAVRVRKAAMERQKAGIDLPDALMTPSHRAGGGGLLDSPTAEAEMAYAVSPVGGGMSSRGTFAPATSIREVGSGPSARPAPVRTLAAGRATSPDTSTGAGRGTSPESANPTASRPAPETSAAAVVGTLDSQGSARSAKVSPEAPTGLPQPRLAGATPALLGRSGASHKRPPVGAGGAQALVPLPGTTTAAAEAPAADMNIGGAQGEERGGGDGGQAGASDAGTSAAAGTAAGTAGPGVAVSGSVHSLVDSEKHLHGLVSRESDSSVRMSQLLAPDSASTVAAAAVGTTSSAVSGALRLEPGADDKAGAGATQTQASIRKLRGVITLRRAAQRLMTGGMGMQSPRRTRAALLPSKFQEQAHKLARKHRVGAGNTDSPTVVQWRRRRGKFTAETLGHNTALSAPNHAVGTVAKLDILETAVLDLASKLDLLLAAQGLRHPTAMPQGLWPQPETFPRRTWAQLSKRMGRVRKRRASLAALNQSTMSNTSDRQMRPPRPRRGSSPAASANRRRSRGLSLRSAARAAAEMHLSSLGAALPGVQEGREMA